ncbi:MAG: SLC13 family permease, partial [Chloroflexota bacterium]|nr:SLC13 family permease [Chloroflexota bacterium]
MTVKRTRLKSTLPKTATWSSAALRPVDSAHNGVAPGSGGDDAKRVPAAGLTTPSKRRLQRRVTPLAIFQQPLQAGVRKVFDLRRFLLVLALTAGVLLLPRPPDLTVEGHRALALFMFTGAILALEPAPLPIAALLVPICQIALGIDVAAGAFAPFGQPVVFLVLASLFLAEALRKHGLTRRLAFYVVLSSGGNFRRLLLGLMSIAGVLSMWVLNTAIAAVLIPVAISIAQRVPRPDDARRALALLVLGIAYGSSIGGIATIMGSNENAIATGLLAQIGSFGFVDWMQYGLPVALLLMPLSWVLLLRALPIADITIDTEPMAKEMQRTGGLSNAEREIIVVLLVSVVL